MNVRTNNRVTREKSTSPALPAALTLADKGNYLAAVNILRSAGRDIPTRNALGVCLLRLRQVEEALNTFRAFVLLPDAVSERPDVSNACKRNFALSLLLSGSPSGAREVLLATNELDHEMAVKILGAIKNWEGRLSWWRWLDWKINRIEPKNCQVTIDFEPGEFIKVEVD